MKILFIAPRLPLPADTGGKIRTLHLLKQLARFAQVQLHIVGKNPSSHLLKLASVDPRVVVTGLVKDVRPYVHHAKAFIVPLRIGGGTRLKILEAMAMGKTLHAIYNKVHQSLMGVCFAEPDLMCMFMG